MVIPYPSSFGDIVTAISIVHSIYNALSDSRGSSFEYQCLVEELRSFEEALHSVDVVLKTAPLSESLRQAINAEIASCLKLLTKFWGRIDRYEVVLSRKWTAIWRKITWVIWKAEEVESFRRKISQHKQNITLFLGGLQM